VRILYLHQYFSLPSQPGSTRSYEMARRLVRWGHQVHVITSVRRPPANHARHWIETEHEGIRVYWVPVPYSNEMSYSRRIWAFFQFAWKAARKAAAIDADLVFATSTPLTIALPGIYAARRLRVPMILEVRDLWPELPIAIGALKGRAPVALARWLERLAYQNSSQIVALSPGMKAGIVRTGYPEECVHVIPNGADLELFGVPPEIGQEFRQRFDWLGYRPLVVYTGALGRMNGVEYLAHIAAFVHETAPEVRFLVLGDGAEKDRVRGTAERLGILEKSFFIRDKVPKSAMPVVLSAADMATSLFIDLPQMWANSANKFFDALASGTPVAINYQGWQADLLRQTGAGIILDAMDAEAAANLLVHTLKDRSRLEQAGVAARKLAEERFSRDLLAKQLETVLLGQASRQKA
jgi:glycosyltransferase involved in cell wall biosynthesis